MKRKRLEGITLNGGKIPEDMIHQMVKTMPDHCTFFNHIRVSEDGLVYVYVPDLAQTNRQHIDIFSPEGIYLYQADLTLPERYRFRVPPHTFKDNYLYIFAEDPDGEVKLIKYSIRHPQA